MYFSQLITIIMCLLNQVRIVTNGPLVRNFLTFHLVFSKNVFCYSLAFLVLMTERFLKKWDIHVLLQSAPKHQHQ